MKIWDEFIASRGSDWSSATSAASPDPSHDTKSQQQTPNELPGQEFSQTFTGNEENPPNPAKNYQDTEVYDIGSAALPCGCPYHAAEDVKPNCGCTHSETKSPISQEPISSQPIQQPGHLPTPVVQPSVLAAVGSVPPSCGCLHASPALLREPILVPVPPLAPQTPVETPAKPSCGCLHHAPAQTPQQTPQSIQQTPQNVQQTPQHIQQTSQSIHQTNQNCGCATNPPTNGPTLLSQPAQVINQDNQQQTCNQRPIPQPISPIVQQNPPIPSIPHNNKPIPQPILPIPAIPQPKQSILSRPCMNIPKRPLIGPLEHLNRPYSHAQSSNPSVLHHVSSSTPVQNIPQGLAENSASQYCECSKVTPAQKPAVSYCNQAQKQSEKTATNSQYSCQKSQNHEQPKPSQFCHQYQPMGQQHTATNHNAPCRCSSCSKGYDWSNHSNGRKPLDWVKHLHPF